MVGVGAWLRTKKLPTGVRYPLSDTVSHRISALYARSPVGSPGFATPSLKSTNVSGGSGFVIGFSARVLVSRSMVVVVFRVSVKHTPSHPLPGSANKRVLRGGEPRKTRMVSGAGVQADFST